MFFGEVPVSCAPVVGEQLRITSGWPQIRNPKSHSPKIQQNAVFVYCVHHKNAQLLIKLFISPIKFEQIVTVLSKLHRIKRKKLII